MQFPPNPLLNALHECADACERCAFDGDERRTAGQVKRRSELNRDCADLCAVTARLVARRSAQVRPMLEACADACRDYRAECANQMEGNSHCQDCCLDTSLRCEQACRTALLAAH